MNWKNYLTKWYGIFGTLWASPVTISSTLFYILPLFIGRQIQFKGRWGWILEWEVIKDSKFDQWMHNEQWAAFSTGNYVLYNWKWSDNERVREHEHRHCWQAFVFGIFQPIVYGIHFLYLLIKYRNLKNAFREAYRHVVWEEDARANEI